MRRHPQADAVETGAREIGDRAGGRDRHHEGQRSGPERLRELQGGVVEQALRCGGFEAVDMGDQRVEARALLGRIDAGDRLGIGRVRAEAVDGLGREGDETAVRRIAAARAGSGLVGGRRSVWPLTR